MGKGEFHGLSATTDLLDYNVVCQAMRAGKCWGAAALFEVLDRHERCMEYRFLLKYGSKLVCI